MPLDLDDIIRQHSRSMLPIATGVNKRRVRLDGIRAVVFDIYGTLIMSGSGDVGSDVDAQKSQAMCEALDAMGIQLQCGPSECFSKLIATIRSHQHASREAGNAFPEVDIVAIWREVIEELRAHSANAPKIDWFRLAVEYEVRANPTWPMPGLTHCLDALLASNMKLGIISNAQFFTKHLFPALLGKSIDDLGFAPDLQYYSYLYGEAKPGVKLYERAAAALDNYGILPSQTLYVGNDMLNDMRGADLVGFRTALFAGDARSLKMREGDSRILDVTPDVVITELADLSYCV